MVAVTSEGLMRVDGYKSSRSGNEREGDHTLGSLLAGRWVGGHRKRPALG